MGSKHTKKGEREGVTPAIRPPTSEEVAEEVGRVESLVTLDRARTDPTLPETIRDLLRARFESRGVLDGLWTDTRKRLEVEPIHSHEEQRVHALFDHYYTTKSAADEEELSKALHGLLIDLLARRQTLTLVLKALKKQEEGK